MAIHRTMLDNLCQLWLLLVFSIEIPTYFFIRSAPDGGSGDGPSSDGRGDARGRGML